MKGTRMLGGRGLLLGLGLCWFATALQAEPRRFVTEPFPPYTFEQKGQPAGPMVELLKAACARLDWQCTIEVLPWRRALGEAERGEAHGIFAMLDTPQRRAFFHMSSPVIEARYAVFSRQGDDFVYRGPDSLVGREVGVYGPSGSSASLEDLVFGLHVKTHLEPDNVTVLRKLGSGRYGDKGLAYVNESVALHLLKEKRLPGLQMAGVAREFGYSFALVKSRVSQAEARQFEEALQLNCRSGRNADLVRPFAVPAAACQPPR